ncbi:MAG: fused MFS/spermidine synthase [Bryobacteraceae bacterium]|nr:fused MFS/spermidine synthase [Bryobacteraceae bacterium]
MIRLASGYFTYLKESASHNEVVEGDGRLVLERESPQEFDVLVVDAFTGDSVPTHLLTREAMAIYTRHLRPDGILAMHISNTALDIEPVVEGIAGGSGFHTRIFEVQPDKTLRRANSKWALLSRNPALVQEGRAIRGIAGMRPWTDDYNSLWPIL